MIAGGVMNPLTRSALEFIDPPDNLEKADIEHRFVEVLTFSYFDEIVEMLNAIDAEYWTEFPVWARNLAYRLANLLEPKNVAFKERAAIGMRSFGPDWDLEADRLEADAKRLRRTHREVAYAH
jgi:hypothetical protein